jgi:hypothetical protein
LILKIAKSIIIGLILPLILLISLIIFKVPTVIINIFLTIAVVYGYTVLLFMLFDINNRRGKFNPKKSIYEWMDDPDDFNEHLVFLLKGMKNKRGSIQNMKAIKEVIQRQSYGKLEELKLYKVYYINLSKESAEELYFKSVLAVLSSIGIFIFREQIGKVTDFNIYSSFLTPLLIFVTIAVITGKLTDNKKRSGLLVDILELCIEEMEKEQKGNNDKLN